jgi:hypothetical protein
MRNPVTSEIRAPVSRQVCGFRTMAIRIPKRCRSRLRADADHDSDAMPITNRDRFGMVIDMS